MPVWCFFSPRFGHKNNPRNGNGAFHLAQILHGVPKTSWIPSYLHLLWTCFSFRDQLDSSDSGSRFYLFGGSFCCFVGLFCYTDLWKLHLPERHKKRGVTVVRSSIDLHICGLRKKWKNWKVSWDPKIKLPFGLDVPQVWSLAHPKSTQLHPPDHHISFFSVRHTHTFAASFPVFPPRYSPK